MYHTLRRSHYIGLYYQDYSNFLPYSHLLALIQRKRADLHHETEQ